MGMQTTHPTGIALQEFQNVWHRLNPDSNKGNRNDTHRVYLRVDDDRLLYVGKTYDMDKRDGEHLTSSHNTGLREAHKNGQITSAMELVSGDRGTVDVLEQRAVAIAMSLGPVTNVVRGGDFDDAEEPRLITYLGNSFGSVAYKKLAHGILPEGKHVLKLEGFYANDARAIMYLSDVRGDLFFNIIPKHVRRYEAKNLARANEWCSWKGWIGESVNVDVKLVDGALLQTNVVGRSDMPLTDGRKVILDACDALYNQIRSRVRLMPQPAPSGVKAMDMGSKVSS
jgi:hypothetical protein